MARFNLELPKEIINDFNYIYDNAENIFGKMTQAGAEEVYNNVKTNIPQGFADSEIMDCLKITKVYKTPSDGGINTKVGFFGYFTNKNGIKTPAPLVANVFEYGSSNFTKKPFFRRSFNKGQIQRAMIEAQEQYSKGLLKE